uniref:Secreted protein n=1 Tax=Nelumbo nucifera TaxID=4432 RepID=A0A822Z8D2_NELNU|nr:TPA_asm: hypothetical protein HUJ06_008399 [Nelumbo nucifera]
MSFALLSDCLLFFLVPPACHSSTPSPLASPFYLVFALCVTAPELYPLPSVLGRSPGNSNWQNGKHGFSLQPTLYPTVDRALLRNQEPNGHPPGTLGDKRRGVNRTAICTNPTSSCSFTSAGVRNA